MSSSKRKRVLLKTVEDSEGILGLVVEGMKLIEYPMAATEGRLIAHDIIEHVNGIKAIGSIDDELEALGGVWFTRGRFNDINRPSRTHDPITDLASDVSNLGLIYCGGVNFRKPTPRTRACDEDVSFEAIIHEGGKALRDELGFTDMDIGPRYYEYMDACIHWMRRGYRKAVKKHGTGMRANAMFWNIAESVDKAIRNLECPGQEFELFYNEGGATCHEHYPEEY